MQMKELMEKQDFEELMAEARWPVRIPEETGHRFHVKVDTDSTANWTPIPGQTGH
jgi:hypothetical protein